MKYNLLKYNYVIIILLVYTNTVVSQNITGVEFYRSMDDFLYEESVGENYKVTRKSISNTCIQIKKIKDPKSGKRLHNIHKAWAIKYKDNYYSNVGYTKEYQDLHLYILMDYIGDRYCYSILNPKADKALKRPKPIPIPLSVGHVVANAIRFSTYDKAFFSKKWKTKKGKKYEVILIDLYDPKKKTVDHNYGSRGRVMDKLYAKKKLDIDVTLSEARDMTLYEILTIIEKRDILPD